MPKISAISQCLNERFYIPAMVENVLPKVDELLIMDNGSEDGTLEYLEEVAAEHPKLKIIRSDQEIKKHYHPSWDEPGKLNHLIKAAQHDWQFAIAADECVADNADLYAMTGHRDTCWKFRRFAVYPADTGTMYVIQWYPDWGIRLWNRKAHGGMKFRDVPMHTTLIAANGRTPVANQAPPALIHYHHGYGPKKTNLGRGQTLSPVPEGFFHPEGARKRIIEEPFWPEFDYDMRHYSRSVSTRGR